MGEICEHFELKKGSKNTRMNSQKADVSYTQKLKSLDGLTISEAAGKFDMSVTDFLMYLGKMEKEGRVKIKII